MALTAKLSIFKNKRTSQPEIFIDSWLYSYITTSYLKIKISPSVARKITPILRLRYLIQACSQGIIVSGRSGLENCFKENIPLFTPYFEALSYMCEYLRSHFIHAYFIPVFFEGTLQ